MNDPDNSAPPPKPPGAARPLRIVSVDDEGFRLEIVARTIASYFKGVTLVSFHDAEEAWQELLRSDPDLLITDDMMGKLNGDELVGRLADRKVAYPIIVINAYGPERDGWVLDYAKRGVPVTLMHAPFSMENLVCALETGLKISRDPKGLVHTGSDSGRTRPLRIVISDDEEGVRESYSAILKSWYDDIEILKFHDSRETWGELLRADPDLFITDIHHALISGPEMLARLTQRKVKYPILVASGGVVMYPENVRLGWGPGLNVTFLQKPFDAKTFQAAVESALQIPTRPAPIK